jgi:hypothetical protein
MRWFKTHGIRWTACDAALSVTISLVGCESSNENGGSGGTSSSSSGTGGIDCSQFSMGPPMGAGGGGMMGLPDFSCISNNCGTPCKDLVDALPMGGPSGGTGGMGGGSSIPGSDVYQSRSCNVCHGDFGQGVSGPNISTSMTAGIGAWTKPQIVEAIRNGIDKDGAALCASMPRWTEAQLNAADLDAIVGFLQALPSIDLPNPGTLCNGNGGSSSGGMMGGPPPISTECQACLDQSCPEIAAIFKCFAGN